MLKVRICPNCDEKGEVEIYNPLKQVSLWHKDKPIKEKCPCCLGRRFVIGPSLKEVYFPFFPRD